MRTHQLIREHVNSYANGSKIHLYRCCYCGSEFEATPGNIRHGLVESCGCLRHIKRAAIMDHLGDLADLVEELLAAGTFYPTAIEIDRYGDASIDASEWESKARNLISELRKSFCKKS